MIEETYYHSLSSLYDEMDEFVEQVRADANVPELKNFLGSVDKHKALFDKAVEQIGQEETDHLRDQVDFIV